MLRFQYTNQVNEIVMGFRIAFSKRSWPYFMSIVLPWLIHGGQRSVRNLVRLAGLKVHESSFYRFFSDGKFRMELFFRILFERTVSSFKLKEILIVVDDTLCPKWGHHIFGTGSFFDHVARPRPGYIWGHNWVVLAIVVQLFNVPVSLPFWVSLYRSKESCSKKEFKTRLQIAAEALQCVKQWTSLNIRLVADGAYNNESLLTPLRKLEIPLISRLRRDAKLRKDLPKIRRKRRGRPPKYGAWLPSLKNIARSGRGWETIKVWIYGQTVTVKVKSFEAWWPKARIKLKVVIVRDPSRRRLPCFLSCTGLNMSAVEIIETFAKRWSIEQMFADAKHGVGLDSAEVRNQNSVVRHGAMAFGFVTIVRLWALKRLSRKKKPPVSFSSQLSFLREEVIAETIFSSQAPRPGLRRNSEILASLVSQKVPA